MVKIKMLNIDIERIRDTFDRELKGGSVSQYMWHLEQYFEYLKEESLTIDDVKDPVTSIEEYTEYQITNSDKPWSKPYVNVAFYAIKKFFGKMLKVEVKKDLFVNRGVETNYQPRILTRNEKASVFREAHTTLPETEQVMIHVGWECALRSGEVVPLKVDNIRSDSKLDVRVLKTKRARKVVNLSQPTYERLLKLIKPKRKLLFYKAGHNRRYSSTEWSKYFRKWNADFIAKGGVRWHDFARHTRLTHYAEDYKNFLMVLQLSGHQNPRECRKYFERANVHVPEMDVIQAQNWNW